MAENKPHAQRDPAIGYVEIAQSCEVCARLGESDRPPMAASAMRLPMPPDVGFPRCAGGAEREILCWVEGKGGAALSRST